MLVFTDVSPSTDPFEESVGVDPDQAQASLSDFDDAVRADPSNAIAKYDLELVLRTLLSQGVRIGPAQQTGAGIERAARRRRRPAGERLLIVAGLVFLTPSAALVGIAVVLPIAAFVLAERRVAVVRRTLMLLPPRGGVDVVALASLVAVVLLLALAAAQPAYSTTDTRRVRTDAQVLFVVDVSQSMAAAGRLGGATRLDRARAAAIRLRSLVPGLSAGVATLTDRVLPNLLPVPDAAAFDATVNQTLAINQPPPRELNVRATNFGALSSIPGVGVFRQVRNASRGGAA